MKCTECKCEIAKGSHCIERRLDFVARGRVSKSLSYNYCKGCFIAYAVKELNMELKKNND